MKIQSLHLKNFKCLENVKFEFGNLNLLAGANGCGKSSLIQSLLLLRQSYEKTGNADTLLTSGNYINLGAANDILYDNADKNEDISYLICDEMGNTLELSYKYVSESHGLKCKVSPKTDLGNLNIWGNGFEYLCAERIAPQTIYSSLNQTDFLGLHGENAFNFLEEYGDALEVDESFFDGTDNKYLLYYVNQWLERIFPGFTARLSKIAEADAVSLRYAEKIRDRVGNPHRAINVGFGITYVLPILVALLKAQKDNMIIIENPEAHLHPRAQRIMGELLAKAALTGAQIIIETHSDHLLNVIRIAAKEKIIEANKIKMFFFMREDVGMQYHVNVYAPQLDNEGNIDIWPEGFFDEWDNALARLF